jgi:hypothetical protein
VSHHPRGKKARAAKAVKAAKAANETSPFKNFFIIFLLSERREKCVSISRHWKQNRHLVILRKLFFTFDLSFTQVLLLFT